MGIRETLNQKPAITTVATIVIIVVMLGVIVYQTWDFGGTKPVPQARAWYTADDGKHWYADDAAKPSPFDYDGKKLYRVFVFSCDGGKTTFPGYLERYTSQTLQKLAEHKPGAPIDAELSQLLSGVGVEIKAPLSGDTGWVSRNDPKAAALLEPRCKATNEPATLVEP